MKRDKKKHLKGYRKPGNRSGAYGVSSGISAFGWTSPSWTAQWGIGGAMSVANGDQFGNAAPTGDSGSGSGDAGSSGGSV